MEIQLSSYIDTVITVITAKPPHSADIINQDKRSPAALFHGQITYQNKNNSIVFCSTSKIASCLREGSGAFFPLTIQIDTIRLVPAAVSVCIAHSIPARFIPVRDVQLQRIARALFNMFSGNLIRVLTEESASLKSPKWIGLFLLPPTKNACFSSHQGNSPQNWRMFLQPGGGDQASDRLSELTEVTQLNGAQH